MARIYSTWNLIRIIVVLMIVPNHAYTFQVLVATVYQEAVIASKQGKYLKVINLLMDGAKKGHYLSMLRLGYTYRLLYIQKPQTKFYLEQAVFWLTRASKKKAKVASYLLARIYSQKKYRNLNNKAALYWYQRSAEQEDGDALNELGWIYYKGKGVAINTQKAESLYLRAIAQGNSYALSRLSMLYRYRPISSINYIQSLKYYNKAYFRYKKEGRPDFLDIKHDLALLHYKYKKFLLACQTWKLLADRGHRGSQYNLARCFEYGIGYKKSLKKALHYYQLAYKQGMKSLKKHIYKLKVDIAFLETVKPATQYFRQIVKVGSQSHCGLVIEVKRPIAKIQTVIGMRWFRVDQLYPVELNKIKPCRFVNGRYLDIK